MQFKEAKDVKLDIRVDGNKVYNGAEVQYAAEGNKLIIRTEIGKNKKQIIEIDLTHLPEATIINTDK